MEEQERKLLEKKQQLLQSHPEQEQYHPIAKSEISGTAAPQPVHKTNEPKQDSQQVVGNICVICRRKFPNEEALSKHVQFSELHQQNLELAKARQTMNKESYAEEKKITREAEHAARRSHHEGEESHAGIGGEESFLNNPSTGPIDNTVYASDNYHQATRKRARERFESLMGGIDKKTKFEM